MKSLTIFAAVLLASPAFAVTADSASVGARALVKIDNATDSQEIGASAPGAPATLSSAASASLAPAGSSVSAASSVRASWASANQGQVTVSWGWQTSNIAGNAGEIDTRRDPGLNWTYNFTTGSQAGTFKANWTMDVVGGEDAFGLNGIYGTGGLPPTLTPFTATPVTGNGSFTIALLPNTSYSFGLLNYGNITGSITDRSVSALFNMDWIIEGGGGNTVPEPASWAMLIAGFGLVGASARRRRALA